MSILKSLKKIAVAHQIEHKANATEKKMRELLGVAGIDIDLEVAEMEVTEPEVAVAPEAAEPEVAIGKTSPKVGREADNVSAIKGGKEGKFYLGNCVKTGKPLYKTLKK